MLLPWRHVPTSPALLQDDCGSDSPGESSSAPVGSHRWGDARRSSRAKWNRPQVERHVADHAHTDEQTMSLASISTPAQPSMINKKRAAEAARSYSPRN